MKRLFAGAAALALCALLVATSASAGAQQRTELRAFDCHRALDPGDRSAAVTAVMRPLVGTKHMAMRFDLLMSSKGATVQRVVNAGDLGVWITPKNPTLGQLPGDVWKLQKSVVNLAAPATYRFRVTFRWTGRAVTRSARPSATATGASSASCAPTSWSSRSPSRRLPITPATTSTRR